MTTATVDRLNLCTPNRVANTLKEDAALHGLSVRILTPTNPQKKRTVRITLKGIGKGPVGIAREGVYLAYLDWLEGADTFCVRVQEGRGSRGASTHRPSTQRDRGATRGAAYSHQVPRASEEDATGDRADAPVPLREAEREG